MFAINLQDSDTSAEASKASHVNTAKKPKPSNPELACKQEVPRYRDALCKEKPVEKSRQHSARTSTANPPSARPHSQGGAANNVDYHGRHHTHYNAWHSSRGGRHSGYGNHQSGSGSGGQGHGGNNNNNGGGNNGGAGSNGGGSQGSRSYAHSHYNSNKRRRNQQKNKYVNYSSSSGSVPAR